MSSFETSSRQPAGEQSPLSAPQRMRWRVVDFVITAVLGVAFGVVFWIWNTVGFAWWGAMDAVTPGFGGFANGVWLIAGVVGGLVIRKPGAALAVELIAAILSASLGSIWGIGVVFSGIAQGIGAEAVFALFRYRRFTLSVAILAGLGAAWGGYIWEFFGGSTPNILRTWEVNVIYLGAGSLSGILLAGVLGWLLVRALAVTGALNQFAVGRESIREV